VTDIPQPSDDPYSVGDQVEVYVGVDDPDSEYHGTVCEVVKVIEDNLSLETGRSLDTYSYKLRSSNTDALLPISFRHRDLVPVEKEK
jgi:hypothetical protein